MASDQVGASDAQIHLLLEKVRQKSAQYRPLQETVKTLRLAIIERKVATDASEKGQFQKCLDSLQTKIKVTSLQAMVERLEAISRQLGLKLTRGPSGMEWFISSDMFYLEVILEASGAVKDVKIQHEGYPEQQSCPEMVDCLSRGNFSSLNQHLEGLAHVYKTSSDPQAKPHIYMAITALETDIWSIFRATASETDATSIFHAPVGLVQKRRGGLWCQLFYFISPYDLFDEESKASIPMTVENVFQKSLGYHVDVTIEASETPQRLQIAPIFTKMSELNSPSFAPLGISNSSSLSCCFHLKLGDQLPLCMINVKQIQEITGIDIDLKSPPTSLFSLIAGLHLDTKSNINVNSGLFVTLPDQQHCYFLTEGGDLQSVQISSVPFTHPSHVPQILAILRKQALLNVLIASCIRPKSKKDFDAITFEVTGVSTTHLSVAFEHPSDDSLCTAEIDLSDLGSLRCRIYSSGGADTVCSADFASKVLQRCLSIPVTMRAIIRRAQAFPGWSEDMNSMLMDVDQSDSGQYGTRQDVQINNFGHDKQAPSFQGDPGFGRFGDYVKGHGASQSDEQVQVKKELIEESQEESKATLKPREPKQDEKDQQPSTSRTPQSERQKPPSQTPPSPIPGLSFPPIPPMITSDLINPVASTSLASLAMGLSIPGPLMPPMMSPDYSALFGPGRGNLAAQEAYAKAMFGLQNMRGMTSPNRKKSKGESGRSPKRSPYEEMLMPDPGMDPALAAFSAFGGMGGLGYGGMSPASAQFFASLAALNRLPQMTQPPAHTPPLPKQEPAESKQEEVAIKKEREDHKSETDSARPEKSEKEKKHREKHEKRSDSKYSVEIDKGSTYPSVSITPVSSGGSAMSQPPSFASFGLDRRPGIEIIPLNNPVSSSVSILPVSKNEKKERRDDKKKDEKDEKKDRKRKADDLMPGKPAKLVSISSGVMGPPAAPSVNRDGSSKPSLSVSVKSGSVSPLTVPGSGTHLPTSPSNKNKTSSPNSKNKVSMSPSHQSTSSSPKGLSSPKHSASPKHPSASPKHSGKPSMSALKNISVKESSSASKHKVKDKGRERKATTPTPESQKNRMMPRTKSFEIADVCMEDDDEDCVALTDSGPSQDFESSGDSTRQGQGSGSDSSSSKSPVRNRKSSLSAVIDKLTRQQNPVGDAKDAKSSEKKDSEFVIKRSSQGIKLTLNKAKAGERSSSSSSSSSKDSPGDSPAGKSASGLKPGTSSGPASRKIPVKSSSGRSPSHSSSKSSEKKDRDKDREKYKSKSSSERSRSDKSGGSRSSEQRREKAEAKPKFDTSFQIPKISKDQAKTEKRDESRKENLVAMEGGTARQEEAAKIPGDAKLDSAEDFVAPARKDDTKKDKSMVMPLSPSVQIHIVKSPAPRNSPMTFVASPKPQPSPIVTEDDTAEIK